MIIPGIQLYKENCGVMLHRRLRFYKKHSC